MVWVNAGTVHWVQAVVSVSPDWHGVGEPGTVHWVQAVVSVSPDWHGVGERGHCALDAGRGECLS